MAARCAGLGDLAGQLVRKLTEVRIEQDELAVAEEV
jgi:hypothetical protein